MQRLTILIEQSCRSVLRHESEPCRWTDGRSAAGHQPAAAAAAMATLSMTGQTTLEAGTLTIRESFSAIDLVLVVKTTPETSSGGSRDPQGTATGLAATQSSKETCRRW